ncbi:ribosome-inactivating family protein [Streptomyces thermolineatus]|uniref:ribosome-inactivating family protein n=1 Tax=Streptomyces thermolineatus TaxID=44033 RepID=UPI00384E1E08
MNPISVVRRAGRRLGTLLLALLAACALVSAGTVPAHAETSRRYTVIDWHMEGYDAGDGGSAGADRAVRYRDMIAQLRAASGHRMAGAGGGDMLDTPTRTNTNRVIEVRVWTNEYGSPAQSHVRLYFSVDNLYLLGFTNRGHNWRFSDADLPLAREIQNHYGYTNPPLFTSIYRGNYGTLDPNEVRGAFHYNALTMQMSMDSLSHFSYENRYHYRSTLAYFIGATAEAARFGWIEHRIAASVNVGHDTTDPNNPDYLGNFGVELQTAWDDLSRLAHRTVNGGSSTPVTVDRRTYTNITQIRHGIGRPRIAPFLALHGSR